MLWKRIDRHKGFTLIELLVVISIIGVLSTIAMTSLNGARAKARDARRKSDLEQISLAMEQYYSDHGTYTISGAGYGGYGAGWFNYEDGSYYKESIARALKEAGYFSNAPRDPRMTSDSMTYAGGQYVHYMLYTCGGGFYVYANLESPTNADKATYSTCACRPGYNMNYAVGHQ